MNIGLLTTYLALDEESDSGIGQHYRILADALAAAGQRVHVVHPTLDAAAARAALARTPHRWTCDVVDAKPPGWLTGALRASWTGQLLLEQYWMARAGDRALAKACRTRDLAVIETHAYDTPAFFFLRRRRRPPVLTRVSTTMGQMIAISSIHSRVRQWQAALERSVTRRSDAVVTHTIQHRDALCALEGHDPRRFAIIPHGLPDPGTDSAPAAGSEARIEFLYVGRFESRKGIDVLLAAIPAVAAACPEAVFVLAGAQCDGRDWGAFVAAHPDLARSRVTAPGRVSPAALATLYRRCTVFVAPSRYESFGLIYAEAMSHGKPVIGCAVGGIPEVVTDGVTGALVPPGDSAALSACMISLARDAAGRHRLGLAARQDFLARFSAATMATRSVELYRELAARSGPATVPAPLT